MAIKPLTVKQLESIIKSNQSGRYAVGLAIPCWFMQGNQSLKANPL